MVEARRILDDKCVDMKFGRARSLRTEKGIILWKKEQ